MIGGHLGVIGGVESCNHIIQNGNSIRRHLTIVSDTLQPEPDRISAVVARTAAASEQVRYKSVTQTAAVGQDEDASFVKTSRYQHQTSHRDESVATPVAEDAVREMWQT